MDDRARQETDLQPTDKIPIQWLPRLHAQKSGKDSRFSTDSRCAGNSASH